MAMQSKLSALALALASLAAPAMAADYGFDGALQSYRSGRASEAYGRMLHLGLKGDPDAARIALFMGENSAVVYNTLWELTDADAAALRKVAQRPSLRPRPMPDLGGYDATGVSQVPARSDRVAAQR